MRTAQPVARIGALGVIGALFLASAGVRLSEAARAQEGAPPAPPPAAAARPQTADCVPEPGVAELLVGIRAREVELDARAGALEDRLQALRLAEDAAAARLAELTAAEEALAATLAIANAAAERDVARLTAVYEAMKPRLAGDLFARMEPGFAAGFVMRMRPEAAGAILSEIDPERAYAISAIMAGRNARAPLD